MLKKARRLRVPSPIAASRNSPKRATPVAGDRVRGSRERRRRFSTAMVLKRMAGTLSRSPQ
jgi:hypothetical protein